MTDYKLRDQNTLEQEKDLGKYDELTRGLLLSRGIVNAEEAEKFFTPDYVRDLHDPFLLPDMNKAVDRILKAIDNQEKIVIFSDYDADGVPGGAVLYDFFEKINYKNFSNYIPHRHLEGFGLNLEAMDDFEKEGVKLVITVDCGVTDVEEGDRLAKHNIDLIITDHHIPGEELPKAVAVVDAKRTDSEYPNKNICGAGVAFKLVQALMAKRDFGLKVGFEKWLLDLVGIATVSDMVSLTGENRALAYYGLKVLRKTPRPGLTKLFKRLKIEAENLTEDDIGFSIAPRINAASRLGDPEDAFKLLIAKDEVEGDRAAEFLEKLNTERKTIVAVLSKEIKKIINERYVGENIRPVLVIGNPNWRPGILGLAANAVLDYHEGAVFLWGREGGEAGLLKGSCRSSGTVSVVELMKRVPKDVLQDFGGHQVSGGFSVSAEMVHKLEEHLCNAYAELSVVTTEKESKKIDACLSLKDVSEKTWKLLEKFMPFGMDNPKPLFLFKNVKVALVKIFGKENNHLELLLTDGTKKVSAIAFFAKPDHWGSEIKNGDIVDIIGTLECSNFRGRREIRIRIENVCSGCIAI